jgi:serine/threonine protein kinase
MTLRGERLDKPTYAILRSMNGGSTGDVYMVDHLVFGRKCVQKTYSTLGLEDAAAHQEPRLLHTIKHEHVTEVLEAQYDPEIKNAITFVTVYYEGKCVAKAFDEGYRFSTHQAIRLSLQILSALAFVHNDPSIRVIHRDIKPGNVFLDAARMHARVGDRGSAARIEADGTVAGVDGSPLYTPPEAGPATGRMTVAGDVYGAAFTLFEMLNGPLDYANIDPIVVDRRLTRGQRAVSEATLVFAPHIPPALRAVVRRGMRTQATERFATASSFIAGLRAVRCIDWVHRDGEDLQGVWEGSWPPHEAVDKRRRYRVRSSMLGAGPAKGKLRLEAGQALTGSDTFARFGVADVSVDPDDRAGVERFFAAVAASVAQRVPAR